MGVYIKGMEMPRNCDECDDMLLLSTIICKCSEFGLNERPPGCPLTEVPEPHGRLIDADACIDYIRNSNQRAWEALAYEPTVIEGSEPLER